jgi:hypothetical protein
MTRNYTKIPGGDYPKRNHKSYVDKFGLNPMKSAFDNCLIKTRLGTDPITGKPITVWDEQIKREEQILESIGERVLFFRQISNPDKDIENGAKCPFCWDERRQQSRGNCPFCNNLGIIRKDSGVTRVGGWEWLKNPDRDDHMFWVHLNIVPQKNELQEIGRVNTHAPRYWTIPKRNITGQIVNYISNRDVFIRFIFDEQTKTPIRELGRYVMTDVEYSLGPSNQLLHFSWQSENANPGIDLKVFGINYDLLN